MDFSKVFILKKFDVGSRVKINGRGDSSFLLHGKTGTIVGRQVHLFDIKLDDSFEDPVLFNEYWLDLI